MEQNTRIAADLGYLTIPPSMQVSKEAINSIPPGQLVIATTGAQGEPMSGLARMANRDHRFVEIQPGDTVIISASPIPGNEEYVSRTIDNLFKAGANVYYHEIRRAHVSGHASQEELKLMLGLTKPRYFIPIHGEFRMQVQHGRLAVETGVAPDNVFIIENGMPIEILARRFRAARHSGTRRLRLRGRPVGRRSRRRRPARPARARERRHVHGRRRGRQADRQRRGAAGDHHARLRRRQRERPDDPGRRRADHRVHREPGRPHQRDRAAEEPDQGRRVALPVRADEAPARWSSRSWWRSEPRWRSDRAPRRRRSTPRSTSRTTSRRRSGGFRIGGPQWQVSPDVARSLVGIALLATGAVTLIALALPGQGRLTDLWRDWIAPWFGTGRWLLPFVLLAAGIYVERARTRSGGWEVRLLGGDDRLRRGARADRVLAVDVGGNQRAAAGSAMFLANTLGGLITRPGAFVVLLGICMAGLLIMLDTTLGQFLAPARRAGGSPARGADDSRRRERGRDGRSAAPKRRRTSAAVGERPRAAHRRPARPRLRRSAAATRSGADRPGGRSGSPREVIPEAVPSAAPGLGNVRGPRGARGARRAAAVGGTRSALAAPADRRPRRPRAPNRHGRRSTWSLPGIDLLEDVPAHRWRRRPRDAPTERGDHHQEAAQLRDRGRRSSAATPVPSSRSTRCSRRADVKVSRIEALADDLAMALAARSLRIEAPIPGKSAVGIEVPNQQSEIVGFRHLIEDADMLERRAALTFALGRDVSGKATRSTSRRCRHLLIAGATGSGKSVCVNALITSLLMHARPDEVRLILIDLKRVELAPYNGAAPPAPARDHRAVRGEGGPELGRQRDGAALQAARRARRSAISPPTTRRSDPTTSCRTSCSMIDELADLIMREGRKVEDAIVKIAQKARAVGIHLVLATQRPSVNVVTGLIKANVPSRIAFAMASMVDSRTVLDQPGAEDLIGRGDMLFQPVDLPRPMRMQGVFVSDREVSAVTDHWRAQAPEPDYDDAVFAFVEGDDSGGAGQFSWLAKVADDEMAVRAAEVVTLAGRASTSMLQTKLKVGFNRASRLIEILERYGVVAPQDPRSPAAFRQVYGPDNWIRSTEDESFERG